MSDSINTVVSDSDVSPVVVKVPGKRGRKPSPEVAARRTDTANRVTLELMSAPGEGFTVSEITRRLEAKGFTTLTLWTDVYTFLKTSTEFASSGGSGTRVKWSWVPSVTESESAV